MSAHEHHTQQPPVWEETERPGPAEQQAGECAEVCSGGQLIDGVWLGHTTKADTGCTVVCVPEGAVASVDVRGGGPGTRETDLLQPHNTVDRVHAVVLSGGSAFGLVAADGAMAELEAAGIGFHVAPVPGAPIVPIVPAAVIFDLFVGDPRVRPTAADGAAATRQALAQWQHSQQHSKQEPAGLLVDVQAADIPSNSSYGAGTGATAGRVRGGIGRAVVEAAGYQMAALMVANPVGEVFDACTGAWFAPTDAAGVDPALLAKVRPLASKLNTTIGVVATDAPLSKAQAQRVAMMAHAGISVAVRPAHSPLDGDTIFCLATGDGRGVDLPTLTAVGAAASEAVAAAIVDAVRRAAPGHAVPSAAQLRSTAVRERRKEQP